MGAIKKTSTLVSGMWSRPEKITSNELVESDESEVASINTVGASFVSLQRLTWATLYVQDPCTILTCPSPTLHIKFDCTRVLLKYVQRGMETLSLAFSPLIMIDDQR